MHEDFSPFHHLETINKKDLKDKSQRKSSVYFITASLLIIGVEILQVLTMSGSGDIDDYILNIVWSMVMYFIVKLYRKVKKL